MHVSKYGLHHLCCFVIHTQIEDETAPLREEIPQGSDLFSGYWKFNLEWHVCK